MQIQINEASADEIEACCTKDYAERGFSGSERLPLQTVYHKAVADTSSESDEILGGLSAYTFGSHLSIALFWVSEGLRGQGIGKALLASAELEAKKRGCTASLVDTFDFQAEGFYVKQGYTPYARLSGGFDNRSTRIYFFKQLSTDSENASLSDIQERFPQLKVHDNLEIDILLNQGLEEHALAELSTPVQYNYHPLGLRTSGASSGNPEQVPDHGLVGHSGGSFLMLEGIRIKAGTGSPSELEDVCASFLKEAERIGREERSCTRVILHAFDFDTALLAASAKLGYDLVHEVPGWFEGRAVRHFLSKAL